MVMRKIFSAFLICSLVLNAVIALSLGVSALYYFVALRLDGRFLCHEISKKFSIGHLNEFDKAIISYGDVFLWTNDICKNGFVSKVKCGNDIAVIYCDDVFTIATVNTRSIVVTKTSNKLFVSVRDDNSGFVEHYESDR